MTANSVDERQSEAGVETSTVNNDSTEKLSLTKLLFDFTQEVGLTGVRFVGDKKAAKFRRLLWLVIVLVALSALLYQVSTMFISYSSHAVNVNIRYATPKTQIDFPAMTICNNNMFSLYGLNSLGYILPMLISLFGAGGDLGQNIPNEYRSRMQSYEYADYRGGTLFTFVDDSGHQIEEMLRSCSFDGKPCGPQNFTKVATNFGMCYTFNGNKERILKISNAGQRYGLTLLLYVNEDEYFGPGSDVGFRLMVHDIGEIPDIAGQGVSISPGTFTSIGLRKTQMSNLGAPYGDCVENIEDNLRYFDGAYSLSKCWIECETDYVINDCGCRYFYMPGNASFCSMKKLKSCYFDSMYLLENYYLFEYDDVGSDLYNTRYEQTFSSTMNPNKRPWGTINSTVREYFAYSNESSDVIDKLVNNLFHGYYIPTFRMMFPVIYEVIREFRDNGSSEIRGMGYRKRLNMCKEFMRTNLAEVTIYFEDLKVQTITQQPAYEAFNLLCDIGGSLGLFFGASIVTFLEILDFFIIHFWKMKKT
ncbi:acid-sensing ion channel 4-A-like [Glandiceps talaboti]